MVSHSSDHNDLIHFSGKRVLVIGAGQSALESAALLHESGANVELLIRGTAVRWLHQKRWTHRWPIEPLLYAPPDVGPALMSHLVAKPNWFRKLPRQWQDRWAARAIRAAGSAWLKPRLDGVPLIVGRSVLSAHALGEGVRLTLDDGTERTVDHVLTGTGFRVDISHYSFIDRSLLAQIECINGYPKLREGFQSVVPGLHFLGAPAAWSFGPLMRFVAGAEFASSSLAGYVRSNKEPRRP